MVNLATGLVAVALRALRFVELELEVALVDAAARLGRVAGALIGEPLVHRDRLVVALDPQRVVDDARALLAVVAGELDVERAHRRLIAIGRRARQLPAQLASRRHVGQLVAAEAGEFAA